MLSATTASFRLVYVHVVLEQGVWALWADPHAAVYLAFHLHYPVLGLF